MKLITLILASGLCASALPSSLLAAKATAAKHDAAPAASAPAEGEAPSADPEQAKLSAAKRKVHELPEIASAQQQAKADRALASKAAMEYKHARAKAAESETAYRKAYEEALAKADPEAAAILKKQREAFREKMLKARAEKNPVDARKAEHADGDPADGSDER